MTNSQTSGTIHVYCHEPRQSAIAPWMTGNTAPPNTPVMNRPEALEVYSFSPSTERVKMQLHITLWNKPTAAISQRFCVNMETDMSMIAALVTVRSMGRGGTAFNVEDTTLPTRKPPQ